MHPHRVISDVTGVAGMVIIRAIVAGEQNLDKLASLKDPRRNRSAADIAAVFVGDHRAIHFHSRASVIRHLFISKFSVISKSSKR